MNKNKGYYFGQYEILTAEYSGHDFSKRCFVFPGQGSAYPGMARNEYLNSKIIQKKFLLANTLAKKLNISKISDYILNPDKIKKDEIPVITNLALFTLNLALFDVLIPLKIFPKVITGHSFGEYAALVASGIISFEEMFEVVYHRDIFCPPANSLGFMIAINADVEKTKRALAKNDYHISNINSPKQTVISTSKNSVVEIAQILESKNIKYKILYNIPQPYHSPYLKDVKNKIEQLLLSKKFSLKKPEFPIYSSVLNKLINKKNFKKKDVIEIFANQIITPVNFIKQIKSINNLDCFNFLEIGPKKLFSTFIEDIITDANRDEIKTDFALNFLQKEQKEVVKPSRQKNNELLSSLSNVIKEITGYKAKISQEDKFQEDLGIDSIKKADILLTALNKLNIYTGNDFSTSRFIKIKDVISYIEKSAKNRQAEEEAPIKSSQSKENVDFKRYIFKPVKYPLNAIYQKNKRKKEIFLLNIIDIIKNKNASLKKIKSLIGKGGKKPNIIIKANDIEFNSNKILLIFKFFKEFLKTTKKNDFNLILLSYNGQSNQKAEPYFYCLSSFFKSVKKELPGVFFKHVHLDKIQNEKNILNIVSKEIDEPITTDVLYKNRERFIFMPKIINDKGKKLNLNEKSVILAIGGAKGITFSLIKNISKKYKSVIYLAGRSPEENTSVSTNIAELKKENSKIYYKSVDACDVKSTEKLFSEIKRAHKKIDLVINGAGVVQIGFLKDKTDEEIAYEFNNRILPAFNILNLSLKYKPKKVINFSSIISKYGSAGQSIYTSANELVSKKTTEYNSLLKKDGSNAVVVHWPPWDKTGMTSNKGVSQKLSEYDVSLLKPKKADELFLSDVSFSNEEPIYYLGDFDDLSYNFTLNNLKQYEPLIGKVSNPFNISASKLIFEKLFDLSKDNYLKDHKINGACYVPAAIGISMFFCAGSIYFKKFPILKNINIYNPIIVKKIPTKCLLEAKRKKQHSSTFSIKSNASHFYCEAEISEKINPSRQNLIKINGRSAKNFIYPSSPIQNSLHLGPVFKNIEKVIFNKNNKPIFAINNSKLLPIFGFEFYDKLIQWVDSLFQAVGATTLNNNFKAIPTKISKISFYPETQISNYVYAVPSKIKATSNSIEGDAVLINENGEVIIELTKIFLKKID